ncbi:MAG TPA: sugar ABC transporter permease [Clostridiales bacterium]|nr:sugar ABC transporter permease [Clostridiales bacterium]
MKTAENVCSTGIRIKDKKLTWKRSWQKYKYLYFLILPGLVYLIIFRYIPMYGLAIAFQDFTVFGGVFGSPFAGLKNFKTLMSNTLFWQAFVNTIRISGLKLIFAFPAPIVFALLLNEIFHPKYRRVVQTISYLPHFVSWVVLAGLLDVFINSSNGVLIMLLKSLKFNPPNIMTSNTWFVPMLIVTDIYKNVGYSSIVYLAAISSIDLGLYESAVIDGASRFRQVWHITIPSMLPIICILLIFNLGNILDGGFSQIFVLYNSLVYRTADIIDTYVYRVGIVSSDYSIGAAAQFFKSLIGMFLIIGANYTVRLFDQKGLW